MKNAHKKTKTIKTKKEPASQVVTKSKEDSGKIEPLFRGPTGFAWSQSKG